MNRYFQSKKVSVADPHHVDADPVPACHFDAYLDPVYYLMWIRILPFTLMLIRILASKQRLKTLNTHFPYIMSCHLQIDADTDPAYHFDAHPDPKFQFDADPDPQRCEKVTCKLTCYPKLLVLFT
jgi:hypothetical protein